MYTIAICGGIASGKTSILQRLKVLNGSTFVCFEPIEKWQNLKSRFSKKNFNMLDDVYSGNISKFQFQCYAQNTFIDNVLERKKEAHGRNSTFFITERSCFDSYYIFAKNAFENNEMSDREINILHCLQQTAMKLNSDIFNIDLVILLDTCPEMQYNRCLNRKRTEEINVSLEYLTQIYECYNNFFDKYIDCKIKKVKIKMTDDLVYNTDVVLSEIDKLLLK